MEPLYRGPLGIVSKARCETKGGRFDAITRLDPRLDPEKVLPALNQRMARVGGLRSPLLVRDKGFVEVDGQVCLASVLVDGVPLRYIVGTKPLPPRVACGLAAKVARALHTAYDRLPRRKRRPYGLIHGDLGPDDIIVADDGDVRVANVGLRVSSLPEGADPLRALVLHPTAWAAPEVADGPPSHASDVYSLMALLAWMITSKVPSYASSEASWHAGVVEATSIAVRTTAGEPALGELVAWGMAHDPADRPRAEEVYGWLEKLTRTLPGPQWQSSVGARIGTGQAYAIEAIVGLDESVDDPHSAPPPAGMDWTEASSDDRAHIGSEIPWDAPTDLAADLPPPPPPATRPGVASVVVDPGRRALDLGSVLPRADDDVDDLPYDDMTEEVPVGEELSFDEVSTGDLSAPSGFAGLQEVSREADAGEDFALEAGDEDDAFELADEDDGLAGGFELESEETEAAGGWVEEASESVEAAVLQPAGATIRIQLGGGQGGSSWGRDDLSDVNLPDHLFKDEPADRDAPPVRSEAPLRGIRLTMPVHEDNLDGFAFEGSEEDAIAATRARGRKHLRLVAEGAESTEDAPTDRAPTPPVPPAPAAPPPPERAVRATPVPAPPSYAPPRPLPRDSRGSPFLWAVGLASALILAIMAANPVIQSWRSPAPVDAPRVSKSKRYEAPVPAEPPPVEAVQTVEPIGDAAEPSLVVDVEPLPEPAAAVPAEPEPTPVEPAPVPEAAPAPPPSRSSSKRRSSSRRRSAPRSPAPPPPEPEAAPPEPPAAAGTVRIEGDAASVRLVGSNGSFGAGSVPAGSYVVQASFGEGSAVVSAGDVVVKEGGQVTVRCNATFMACKVR